MSTVLAYLVVIVLVQVCLRVGMLFAVFPVALILAWSSVSLRTKVAGFIGGLVGVAASIGFGYTVFSSLVGPGSFTVGSFLASTVPLLIPVMNDLAKARQVEAARQELLSTLRETRDEETVGAFAERTRTAHYSALVGYVTGFVLATMWFVNR